jgi:uncharacterized membrane protein YraQ (UPF0718 family)
MAWEVWWALVFGFLISGVVQAWVPRSRIENALAGSGAGPMARATALGAASSSCSYAAVAIARSLFAKGASAATALAFQFASTNLVWELGLVLWVLIGWQFTLAEYVGGLVLIGVMWALLRLFVSGRLEGDARAHAERADSGHAHHGGHNHGPHRGGTSLELTRRRRRVTSLTAWAEVADNFRSDWQMLYKEIATGFVLAGFVGLLGNDFFRGLFITHAAAPIRIAENVVVGPLVAVLSFVCSVGNVPLAAVLWSGGISFGGVIAFLFADLIVLPIIAIYRKYYGWSYTARITALMFVSMVLAAVVVEVVFSGVGLIPAVRPTRAEVFSSVQFDYKLVLNAIALVAFAGLFTLSFRRREAGAIHEMTPERAS